MSRDRARRKREREESSEEYTGEIKKLRQLPSENRIVDSKLNEGKTSQIVDFYAFGSNDNGQLGQDSESLGASAKLVKIDEISDLNCLSYVAGRDSNLVVEVNTLPEYRNVYSWGGDESLMARDGDHHIPARIEPLHEQPLIQIACGSNHAVALTSTGEVVSWGIYKDRKGKFLGFRPHLPKEEFQDIPEIMTEIEEDKIIQVACTHNRSLALTETGEIYEWGNTKLDSRTLERHAKETLLPSKVLVNAKMTAIYAEANGGTIFAETIDGKIYAWGNNEHYQCGIDEEVTVKAGIKDPKAGAERAKARKEKIATHSRPTKAKQINTILEEEELKVKKISCGRYHSVLLTTDGHVYTWGDNTKGQLGLGRSAGDVITVPSRLGISAKIVDVASGPYHTLLLTEDGEIYGFGVNKDRCLADANEEQDTPKKLALKTSKIKGKIVGIACGARHNLVVVSTS